jgi:glucose-6-phosphate 1-dehydrogenase
LELDDCLLGQFTGNTWTAADGAARSELGYLEDKTVPEGSRCPTFAAVVLNVDNERWRGVPFLMRAGKAADESLAEVRVMFRKKAYNDLVPSQPNELVIRIQPDAAIYMNCTVKRPGWSQDHVAQVSIDMSYKSTFPECYVAEAYERMILQAAKGERSLFVGADELVESWRIFTPLLDTIDRERPEPSYYPFGSPAPEGLASFAQARGVRLDAAEQIMSSADSAASNDTKQTEASSATSSALEAFCNSKSQQAKREQREATPPRPWLKANPSA